MIGFITLFWEALSRSLTWLPPLCIDVLVVLGAAVIFAFGVSVIGKVVKLFT